MDIILYIVIGIVFLIIVYVFATYNSLTRLKNNVAEAFSTMDVYLKKRWDLIPNVVQTVKGYAKHEKETLEEIIKLRNKSYDSLSSDSKITKNEQLAPMLDKLFMLAESYPELKANENYLDLQKQLSKVEEDIAQSRKYYNAVVRDNNNKVEMIPSNAVAKMFNFKLQKMFQASESEREVVDVKL